MVSIRLHTAYDRHAQSQKRTPEQSELAFGDIGDGRCFASAINDVTVSSLDWTRAESSPDGLVRVYSFANGIALGGENTTELYQNTANPTGFPFTRSAVLPYGLFGKPDIERV